MPRLWKISYVSVATAPNEMIEASVRAICLTAQVHNKRAGITGVLTFDRGRFAQLIEGPQKELRALISRIMVDPRHHSLKVVNDGPIATRCFSDWAMEYRTPKDFVQDQLSGLLRHALVKNR